VRRGQPGGEDGESWDIEVLSEPFTLGSEENDTALARLQDHAREHQWDIVVGLTELPLRDQLLAGSLSWWRLVVATIASITLVVGWLVVDSGLWDRPDDNSAAARERSRLYNTSTLVTLTVGVIICYLALYVVNLACLQHQRSWTAAIHGRSCRVSQYPSTYLLRILSIKG